MALLKEQKNVVKAMCELHETKSIEGQNREVLLGAVLGAVPEADILRCLFDQQIFTSDRGKSFAHLTKANAEFLSRKYKIGMLYQSCKDDGFIEPYALQLPNSGSGPHDIGFRVTSRGTDLLNFWGFIKIVLEKHDKTMILLTSAVVVAALTWIIPKITCVIIKLPYCT